MIFAEEIVFYERNKQLEWVTRELNPAHRLADERYNNKRDVKASHLTQQKRRI